jgi:hypothetical protein
MFGLGFRSQTGCNIAVLQASAYKELFPVAALKRQNIATAKNVFPSSRNLWNKRRREINGREGS